ncbi:SH2 domain-containing protein 1B [Galemys pyrenaicus]|uniref:SH2 domain-containing protein 1B n=1 Tax=Galemys pyrenaicus TaxID=202257 RepID=A0A8J6DWT2_GALPY|nr:SH2 domain-containing protein 1B [Galemys pyrenaicus]
MTAAEQWPTSQAARDTFKKFVYTYRIFKEKHGYYNIQTAEGAKKQTFSSLKELISQYEKPNQGLVVNLLKPVKRTSPCLGWRTSKLDLDKTYEDKNDYVNSSSCVNSNTVYGKSGSVLGESSSVYANSDSVLGKSGSVYANSDRVLGDSGSVYANSDSEDVYSSKDYVDVLP